MSDLGVGRLLLASERAARVAHESSAGIPNEGLRSAFVISAEHMLTAWHCVRNADRENPLWFRMRGVSVLNRGLAGSRIAPGPA